MTRFLGESFPECEPRRLELTFLFVVHVSGQISKMRVGKFADDDYSDWLNSIQHLSVEKHGQIFLTLNPPFEPNPELVFKEFVYDHPVLDANVNFSLDPFNDIRIANRSYVCRPSPSNAASAKSKTRAESPTQAPGSATASTRTGSPPASGPSSTPSPTSTPRSRSMIRTGSRKRRCPRGCSIGWKSPGGDSTSARF